MKPLKEKLQVHVKLIKPIYLIKTQHYEGFDFVLSDNQNREKLKELTEIHLREKEISLEENQNLEEENVNDDFEEPEDEE